MRTESGRPRTLLASGSAQDKKEESRSHTSLLVRMSGNGGSALCGAAISFGGALASIAKPIGAFASVIGQLASGATGAEQHSELKQYHQPQTQQPENPQLSQQHQPQTTSSHSGRATRRTQQPDLRQQHKTETRLPRPAKAAQATPVAPAAPAKAVAPTRRH